MKESLAKEILAAVENLSPPLEALSELTLGIENEDERKAVRTILAKALHQVGYELVMFVVRQHPHLDPDRDPVSQEGGLRWRLLPIVSRVGVMKR